MVERKQSAVMQDRIGANRANLGPSASFGLFQIIADSIKMIVKEDFVSPRRQQVPAHASAPDLDVLFAHGFCRHSNWSFCGDQRPAHFAECHHANLAILFLFAMLSLEIYGAVFAGYSSNNNYAMMGGLRASAQMFSYEITFGATVVGLLMIFGSMDIQNWWYVRKALRLEFLPKWGVFLQPLGFHPVYRAGLAETKRIPFDLPEGESEIVGTLSNTAA